jgi:hypothetical protein
MCGIRPAEILQEHMFSARMASNLMLGRWSSKQVPLWKVDLQTIPLVQGTASYNVPSSTITMLDTYVTINGPSVPTNRILLPITRSEYATYPNPTQQGATTVYWFDRLLSPTVTLWPVPDGTVTSLSYYRIGQIQDSNFTSGQTVDVPEYFLEAFATGLASRLAITWAVDRAEGLKALADEAFDVAANQNTEAGNFYVSPAVAGYWRP